MRFEKTGLIRWLCVLAVGCVLTACSPAESTKPSAVSSAADEPAVQPASSVSEPDETPEPSDPAPAVDQNEGNNSSQPSENTAPANDPQDVEMPVIEITSQTPAPAAEDPQPTIAPEDQPVETPVPNEQSPEEPAPEEQLPGDDDNGEIELPIIPVN